MVNYKVPYDARNRDKVFDTLIYDHKDFYIIIKFNFQFFLLSVIH